MQAEAAASGDDDIAIVERIGQFRQSDVTARSGSVDFGGAFHVERLVRSFDIELAHEAIEAILLLL